MFIGSGGPLPCTTRTVSGGSSHYSKADIRASSSRSKQRSLGSACGRSIGNEQEREMMVDIHMGSGVLTRIMVLGSRFPPKLTPGRNKYVSVCMIIRR